MENEFLRYSVTRDGRLLDSEPWDDDKPMLVFDKASRSWVTFNGTVGDWRRSTAITAEEAARLTGGVPGYEPPATGREDPVEPDDDGPPQPPFSVDVVDQF